MTVLQQLNKEYGALRSLGEEKHRLLVSVNLAELEGLLKKESQHAARIAEMEARASQLTTQERRQKDQMAKDLKECLEYHDELHVVADHNISFDLDDGVVKNYALFGNVLAKLK